MVQKKWFTKSAAVLMAVVLTGAALLTGCGEKVPEVEISTLETGSANTGGSLHDPFIIQGDDGVFYCYGSHMTAARSDDLSKWKSWANGVTKNNKIFDNLLVEPFDAFAYVGKGEQGEYSVWAPSVIYNKKSGRYIMYFCTTSSYIQSNLCMAESDSPEGPYHYTDTVIYSGLMKPNLTRTNYYDIMGQDKQVRERYITAAGYNNQLWPNAIDPAMFYDRDDRLWMVYGSWSGGIFLLELDPETSRPIHPETDDSNEVDKYYGKRLVGGFHHAIEGPYIHYDSNTDMYYLFLSYGNLQAQGGYQIRVFRSENPDGPYTDASGHTLGLQDDLDHFEQYGTKLMGNYTLPTLGITYMAPGGQSTFEADGKLYIVYHQRYKDRNEEHSVRVHQMAMNSDGWPCIFPFQTAGETLSADGYSEETVRGTYYLVDHGLAVDASVNEPVKCTFSKGKIRGDVTGSYTLQEGSNYIDITIGDDTFKGVLVDMPDEAGNSTRCFSAVSDNNHALWGVQYLEGAK